MIEYVSNFYEAEKRPTICKKFAAANGEESHTIINVGNESELSQISAETVYEHMANVLRYLDAKLDTMALVQLDELAHSEPWPVKGWSEVEWCQNEIVLWWNYIYYKDYDERFEAALTFEMEHTHDHTHDSEEEEEEETPDPSAEGAPQ
jgi:hypothetical protein